VVWNISAGYSLEDMNTMEELGENSYTVTGCYNAAGELRAYSSVKGK